MKKMINSTRGVRSAYVSPQKGAFIVVLTGAIQTKVRETEGAPCVVYQNECMRCNTLSKVCPFFLKTHQSLFSSELFSCWIYADQLSHISRSSVKKNADSFIRKSCSILCVKLWLTLRLEVVMHKIETAITYTATSFFFSLNG